MRLPNRISAFVLFSMIAAYFQPDTAAAQQRADCAPRERIVARLAEHFGETRRSIGLGANNAVVEVFASAESGSWTITVTAPNGQTCLVASGQAFETLAEALPKNDSDA